MWKINLKTIVVALLITIAGIILALMKENACVSIGCSLIASAVLSILTALIVDREKVNPLDEWGMDKIYATRAEKNADSDPNLDKAKYCVDGIAFGLTSFRTKYSKKVTACLRKGVNFRLLVMNPESEFIKAREKEEDSDIKHSIESLVKWANDNNKSYKGKIIVKGYNSMTLDIYWRVDDDLYIGPYWYGYKSGDTITYKFNSKGKAFQLYTDYFESLWENTELTEILTDVREVPVTRKRKKYAVHSMLFHLNLKKWSTVSSCHREESSWLKL